MDSWFSALDNFEHIVKAKNHFIAALKNNRLVALSEDDMRQGRFVRIEMLALSDKQPYAVVSKVMPVRCFWCDRSLQTKTAVRGC